jgi:hypothetical protein
MARQFQLYMWKRQRAHFVERHDFYVEQVNARVFSQFRDIETEATKYADEAYEAGASSYGGDDGDLSQIAEAAHEAGLGQYELLSDLKSQMILGSLAGLYHQWEKDLRGFIEQELHHDLTNAAKIAWEDTRNINDVFDLFAEFGWNCRSEKFYPKIDACRLIVNVHKHGKGGSFRELIQKYPEYISQEARSFDDASFVEYLGHKALAVTESTFEDVATTLRDFWEKIPGRLYYEESPNP